MFGFIPVFGEEVNVFNSPESLSDNNDSNFDSNPVVSDPSDVIFHSSAVEMIDAFENVDMFNPTASNGFGGSEFKHNNSNSMPLFKQMRIKAVNQYRLNSQKEKTEKDWSKLKFWQKKDEQTNALTIDNDSENPKSDLINNIDNAANIETSDVIGLEGSVNEEDVEKQLLLDAANINYDNITGEMVATGRPILFLPPQQTKIIADVMTYDDQGNILKATGNVVIIKEGKVTHSDYLEVNLNEETIDADNIFAEFPKINITAEHGLQQDGLLIFNKGTMFSDEEGIHRIKTQMVGPNLDDMIIADDAKSLFFGQPEHSVDIKN